MKEGKVGWLIHTSQIVDLEDLGTNNFKRWYHIEFKDGSTAALSVDDKICCFNSNNYRMQTDKVEQVQAFLERIREVLRRREAKRLTNSKERVSIKETQGKTMNNLVCDGFELRMLGIYSVERNPWGDTIHYDTGLSFLIQYSESEFSIHNEHVTLRGTDVPALKAWLAEVDKQLALV